MSSTGGLALGLAPEHDIRARRPSLYYAPSKTFDDNRRNRSRVAKKEKEKYEGREKTAKEGNPYGQCTQLLVRHQYAWKAVREQVPHWIISNLKPTIQVALGHTEVYSVLALAPQIAPTSNDNCHVTLTHANGRTSLSWISQMTRDDH